MNPIKLIVGLGNPGIEYQNTRHNAGFWMVNQLVNLYKSHFSYEKKFSGELARCLINQQEIRLLKPTTFMNHSGQAVGMLAKFYQIKSEEILIIHDELDLPSGNIKLKLGGGNGGHNGLKSIQAHLGTGEFWRLRIGIDHPGDKNQVTHYVLKKPSNQQLDLINLSMQNALELIPEIITHHNHQAVIQKLHTRINPTI